MNQKTLYHASAFLHEELKPGIEHSGVLTNWDVTESNEWLYATTDREEAISQGLASVVEKKWRLSRYQTNGDKIVLHFERNPPTRKELNELSIYPYSINWESWVWTKVDNKHNDSWSEYKTKANIKPVNIKSTEPLDLDKWLKNKSVTIYKTPSSAKW